MRYCDSKISKMACVILTAVFFIAAAAHGATRVVDCNANAIGDKNINGIAQPADILSAPWKFAVIGDTQWTVADDGYSPNTVPAGIIKQINQEFINKGVKFVIAIGDTVDVSTAASIDTRALYVQDLYNAGIGFYPIRGNHEAISTDSGPEFTRVFPQTKDGVNNRTPVFPTGTGNDMYITPVAKTGSTFTVGTNFSSPNLVFNGISKLGLSYSFDCQNARFVLLDQWDDSGNVNNSTIAQQQNWITAQLSDSARPQHAFVFGHKNLLGGNHKDNLFGNHTGTDPGDAEPSQLSEQDAFISSLAKNNVRYYICGHDHHHYDSVVKSPLSKTSVHQIISAPASSKFYVPTTPFSNNDTPISQDLNTIGYYIYTVDGPRVIVDYYDVPVNPDANGFIHKTPTLTGCWKRLGTFGYNLNGKEFLVAQGQSYNCVQDIIPAGSGFVGTSMRIIYGTNNSVDKTNYGKVLTKAVNTGWTARKDTADTTLKSDILSLWGMSEKGSDIMDIYVLSLSFVSINLTAEDIASGNVFLATKDSSGKWVNAVDTNRGGNKNFIPGAFVSGCHLGSYGIDMAENTVWAVVNHDGDFAVIEKRR